MPERISTCKNSKRYKGKRFPVCNGGRPCDSCIRKFEENFPYIALSRQLGKWIVLGFGELHRAEFLRRHIVGVWKWSGPTFQGLQMVAGSSEEETVAL